jgi:hypothetical protein
MMITCEKESERDSGEKESDWGGREKGEKESEWGGREKGREREWEWG